MEGDRRSKRDGLRLQENDSMIIVEGPDNAGKSTLIKQLLEMDPSLRLLHRERFKKGSSETIASSYLQSLIPTDGDRVAHGNSIADRFLASECIYGDLFRGGCRMSEGEHLAIRHMLGSYKAMVVHCNPGIDVIMRTWQKREQLYDTPAPIVEAYHKRITTIFRGLPAMVHYDWTKSNAENVRKRMINRHRSLMELHEDKLCWWSALPHGAGQLNSPKVVLVGEQLSPRANTTVPFAHGPAGDFLAWTIEQAGIRLKRDFGSEVYVTNALKGTDRDASILREELRGLDLPSHAVIIALGKQAAEVLRYIKPSWIRMVEMLHPMYMRRFFWPQRGEYVERLATAVEPSLNGN